MVGSELDIIKGQLLSGNIQAGSVLARVLNDLPAQQMDQLRLRAAEGVLGLELEKLAMSQRFQSSSVEIKEFIERIKELETSASRMTRFKATGDFETASGKTTITAQKGCYIASVVYESKYHHKVLLLRDFRDNYLLDNMFGYQFCRVYYKVSPYLAKYLSHNPIKYFTKLVLDIICKIINNKFRRNRNTR